MTGSSSEEGFEDDDDEDEDEKMSQPFMITNSNLTPRQVGETVVEGASLLSSYYPANIAAACQEASECRSQPKPVKAAADARQVEKRRQCNRHCAQQWRNRRRNKFTQLQDQIRALQNEQTHLELENARLKAELKRQCQIAGLTSPSITQPAIRQHGSVTAHAKFDLLARNPCRAVDGPGLLPVNSMLTPATVETHPIAARSLPMFSYSLLASFPGNRDDINAEVRAAPSTAQYMLADADVQTMDVHNCFQWQTLPRSRNKKSDMPG